ncbi:MAG: hypothetical protein V2A74_00685 [bacterium]
MIDQVLERRLADCKELFALWRTFHDFFSSGVKGEDLSHDKEVHFLEIKSRVAMLHDAFMESLTHDHSVGQTILDIVTRSITLKHLNRLSPADIKKMEIEWHESYLLLNETIGMLDEKRQSLAEINATQFHLSNLRKKIMHGVKSFFGSIYFKLGVALGVVLFVIFGLPAMGIFEWSSLRNFKITQGVYIGVTAAWRGISPDFPYPAVEDLLRAKRRIPDDWKGPKDMSDLIKDPTDLLNGLARTFRGFPVYKELKEPKELVVEEYQTSNGDMRIFYLRLATTAAAKDAQKKFAKWYFDSGKDAQALIDRDFSLFQTANIIVIAVTGNDGARRALKEIVFKVTTQ